MNVARSRVLLIDPKYPHNVGNALRACAVLGAAELLWTVHPEDAVYVFGPEDGGVPIGVRTVCHRFVCIPGTKRTPLNLAAAVNIVLYDRISKQIREHGSILDRPTEAVRS